MMSLLTMFHVILESELLQDIVPFLQSLSAEQRRELAPEIMKVEKEYSGMIQSGNSWKSKQTEKQRSIIIYASIVCLNKAEFFKTHSLWTMEEEYLSRILPWYVPSWLSDFINTEARSGWLPPSINYEYILELADAGYISPAPELIATLLVPYIFDYKTPKSFFKPEKLLIHPASLSIHIWYLFSYPTNISFNFTHTQFEGYEKGENPSWINAIIMFTEAGKLDRMAIMRESLLAANRNFSKNLAGWFTDLLTALNPTTEELIKLQPELFSLLNAPHGKPVDTSLNMLKKIAGEEQFEYNIFLEYMPVLTASHIKSVIAASLSISEYIWKKNNLLAREIAPLVCQVFVTRDEAVQIRAAQLLLKLSRTAPLELSDTLASYNQTLLANPKTILRPLTGGPDEQSDEKSPAIKGKADGGIDKRDKDKKNREGEEGLGNIDENVPDDLFDDRVDKIEDEDGGDGGDDDMNGGAGDISDVFENDEVDVQDDIIDDADEDVGGRNVSLSGNINGGTQNSLESAARLLPFPEIEKFDDLIFLLNEVLDHNQSWQFDHVISGLVRFQAGLDAERIRKLSPAFQRAWKYLTTGWSHGAGFLDYIFAYFMIDIGMIIISKHPEAAAPLRELYDQNLAKSDKWYAQWQGQGTDLVFFTEQNLKSNERFYDPYKKLLAMVLGRIKSGIDAPLLSTPTHAPGWLDPNILIERLLQYKRCDIDPDNMDLQLAISRCRLDMVTRVTLIEMQSLPAIYRNLLAFLFSQEVPTATMEQEALWLIAAITKDPGTVGAFVKGGSYNSIYLPVLTGQYPWVAYVEDYQSVKQEYINGRVKTTYLPAKRHVLRLQTAVYEPADKQVIEMNFLKNFFRKLFVVKEPTAPNSDLVQLIYQSFVLRSDSVSLLHNDLRRLIMMIPNNPEAFVAVVVHKILVEAPFAGEPEKKLAIAVLQVLTDLPAKYNEIVHLFIAGCMSGNDRTVASYAVEFWTKAVHDGDLNSGRIGNILGYLYAIDYAPMRRFTDLVISSLFNISALHNKALEQLLSSLMLQLPMQPVSDLKELLELFSELITINQSSLLDKGLLVIFSRWQTSPDLEKTISKIRLRVGSGHGL